MSPEHDNSRDGVTNYGFRHPLFAFYTHCDAITAGGDTTSVNSDAREQCTSLVQGSSPVLFKDATVFPSVTQRGAVTAEGRIRNRRVTAVLFFVHKKRRRGAKADKNWRPWRSTLERPLNNKRRRKNANPRLCVSANVLAQQVRIRRVMLRETHFRISKSYTTYRQIMKKLRGRWKLAVKKKCLANVWTSPVFFKAAAALKKTGRPCRHSVFQAFFILEDI